MADKICARPDCKSTAHGEAPFCITHTNKLDEDRTAQNLQENQSLKSLPIQEPTRFITCSKSGCKTEIPVKDNRAYCGTHQIDTEISDIAATSYYMAENSKNKIIPDSKVQEYKYLKNQIRVLNAIINEKDKEIEKLCTMAKNALQQRDDAITTMKSTTDAMTSLNTIINKLKLQRNTALDAIAEERVQ